MELTAQQAKWLKKQVQNDYFTGSQMPNYMQPIIEFYEQSRLIKREKKGRGFRYYFENINFITQKINERLPIDKANLPADIPPKQRAILAQRNAHKGEASDYFEIKLRSHIPTIWQNTKTQKTLDIYELTKIAGMASILLNSKTEWKTDKPIVLVENLESWQYSQNSPLSKKGTFLYYAGRISETLFNWLIQHKATNELWVFCDLDFVGLQEYLKLKSKFANTKIYLPENIEYIMQMFGNKKIYEKGYKYRSSIEKMINQLQDKDAQELFEIILKYRVGCEQEIMQQKS
jgi:hypothetical protein